jgi:hypothetical protein
MTTTSNNKETGYLPQDHCARVRRHKSWSAAAFFTVLLVWGTIYCFDFRRIGKVHAEDYNMSLIIHAILLLVLLGMAWLISKPFRRFCGSCSVLLMIGAAIYATAIGFVRGNIVGLIALDWKILAWVIGGYALFTLLAYTRHPRVLLIGISMSIYALLIEASRSASVLDDFGRIGGGVYWDYSEMSFVAVGVLFCYFFPFQRATIFLPLIAGAIHIYYVIVLGENRSDLFAFLIFGVCALSVTITTTPQGVRRRKTFRTVFAGTLLVVGLIILGFWRGVISFSEGSVLARVSVMSATDFTALSRWDELKHFFEQSSKMDLLFGRGFGATVRNVNDLEEMNYLHIAVFSYLMKCGIFPFVIIVTELYIGIPYRFVASLFGSNIKIESRNLSRMSAFPFIIGWLSLTLMSGGIDWYYTLGVGMAWAAFHSQFRGAEQSESICSLSNVRSDSGHNLIALMDA